MGRKAKKKPQNPPLSFRDKSFYVILMFLSIFLAFFILWCFFQIKDAIAFSDKSVVAQAATPSLMFSVPFCAYAPVSIMVFSAYMLTYNFPIWGNKKINYGEYPWAKDCFPLFDKRRKSVYVKPSKKRFRRKLLIVWCAVLLVTISLLPLSLFGRYCFHEDNSITTYNIFNQKSDIEYTKEDFSHLEIAASITYRPRYTIHIVIKMQDGKEFVFSLGDFKYQDDDIKKMLEIKKLFSPESITIRGEHRLDRLIDYLNLNEDQQQIIRELFAK